MRYVAQVVGKQPADPMAKPVASQSSSSAPWKLLLIGLASFAGGLGLVSLTIHPPPEGLAETAGVETEGPESESREPEAAAEQVQEATPAAEPEAQAAAPEAQAAMPEQPAIAEIPDGQDGEAVDEAVEAEVAEVTEAEAAPQAPQGEPNPLAARHRVRRDRVAYIRCEGAEDRRGRCPRDRDLENAVWAILENLPQCPAAPENWGTADVRLRFQPNAPTQLRFRDWGRAPLALPPMVRCLEHEVAPLRTTLPASTTVVSFRFEYR